MVSTENMPRARKHKYDLDAIVQRMRIDRLSMRNMRETRFELEKEAAGSHYSEQSAARTQPVNLLSLYRSITKRSLYSKFPQMMYSTDQREMKPAVAALQSWANKIEIPRLSLGDELESIVDDAMVYVGIGYVGIATPADVDIAQMNLTPGQPFVKRVDLDDLCWDTNAKSRGEFTYVAHRFRVRADVITKSNLYNSANRKNVQPSMAKPFNDEGDQRISTMARGTYTFNADDIYPMVDCWLVWLPHMKLILTLDNENMSLLREQEWVGPDSGPYHFLSFRNIVSNAMPKGPLLDLWDLHDSINNTYRKLDREAHDFKSIIAVAGGKTEDGNRVLKSSDQQLVQVDSPQDLVPMKFNGPEPMLINWVIHLRDIFNYASGNISMTGGLEPQSKTLGQDRMLAQNSSATITDMQQRVLAFMHSIGNALAWYWWHDPFRVMKTTHSLPSVPDIQITRRVYPANYQSPASSNILKRLGKFSDLHLEVNPYSMQFQSPSDRLQFLNGILQMAAPFIPVMRQQGYMLDVKFWLQKIAEYGDAPDIAELFGFSAPTQEESSGSETPQTMPQETTRNYNRVSNGGNTPQNREAGMLNNVNGKQNQGGTVTPMMS